MAGFVALPLTLFNLSAWADPDYIPKKLVPVNQSGIVHHGPLDCVTAGKVVREKGYQDVRARDCSGEIYHFRAERNGRKVLLRVDREDGRVTRG
jgi:hypothetical protein